MTDTNSSGSTDGSYEISAESLSKTDLALLEYGKDSLVKSGETIKDFSQSMITLVSGMFAVYFALLEFLDIKSITSQAASGLHQYIILPPILYIISLIAFVLAIMPLRRIISIDLINDIKEERRSTLIVKYAAVIVGMALFVASLVISAIVFVYL